MQKLRKAGNSYVVTVPKAEVERHGWQVLRINGSHHIYGRPGSIVRLSIPIGGVANVVGNGRGAISGNMKVSFQAARSILGSSPRT